MPREPVSGVDYNTHSDVQTCLNDIMNAVKGDEVRGSIHDAIALIDDRSVNLEQEIREEVADMVEPIVEDVVDDYIDAVYPVFSLSTTGGENICSMSGSDLYTAFQAGKIIAPSVSYQGPTRYNVWCYSMTRGDDNIYITLFCIVRKNNNSIFEVFNVTWNHVSAENYISCTVDEYQLSSGGGGSYTNGNGINITNDEISVKLRSSNPGLAFTNDGELYATGSGGSAESFVININDIPPAALYINKTFNEIITQIGQDYGLIRVFLNYKDGYFNRKVDGIISHYESYGQEAYIQFRFNISNDKNNTIRYYLLELDNEFSLEDEYTQENQAKLTDGDAIDITNNVISIDEPVYITMTEGANGIVDTSFIVSITEANFLAKFGIGAKDLMAILSGSYNVAKLGIKVYDDTSISMDSYLDKIPILDIRYSKYDEELSLAEGATMIFIWNHCTYEFTVNVEYSDEFRGTISKINGSVLKTLIVNTGYGINSGTNSISVNTSVIQKKLTSTNAGTGISIVNDAQGNPVISLDLPQAEGGGF